MVHMQLIQLHMLQLLATAWFWLPGNDDLLGVVLEGTVAAVYAY